MKIRSTVSIIRNLNVHDRIRFGKFDLNITVGISCLRVQARDALIRKEPGDVEKVWKDLKDCFLEEAVDVCGETQGIARQNKTW